MSKFKIINLVDQLFISVCVFLVIYAWINFYIRNLWTTFILSLIFSFAIIFILFYFLDKKQNKAMLNKKKADDMNKYHLAFRLLSDIQKLELIKSILEKKFIVSFNETKLMYSKNNENHLIIISTEQEKLNQNDLLNLITNITLDDITQIDIICNAYSTIKTKILKNVNINLIDKEKLFNEYFCSAEIFPDISRIDNSITKFSWREFALNMFTPNKAKSYFFAGFILIFSSIILPYHIYYLLFGSTLIIFSILCKLLPKIKNWRNRS